VKLYRVRIEYTAYVVAQDSEDAEAAGLSAIRYEDQEPDNVFAEPVEKKSGIDHEWENAIPFGKSENDETCEEAFERLAESNNGKEPKP
jgi:hypothetical protein